MKNLFASNLLLAAALTLTLGACKKDTAPTPTPAPAAVPTPTPPSPSLRTINGTAMGGVLVSLQMDYSYVFPQLPVPFDLQIESAVALFFNSATNTYLDAGAVSVNTKALDKSADNGYVKAGGFSASATGQTTTDLGFDMGSNWSVAGGSGIPTFTYSHSTPMPGYTGTLPTTITKASGLTLSLNASNADSVYVLLASGDKSILRRVGGRASSVTFTAAQLSILPANSNNTGLVEVIPFKYLITSFGNKPFVFVKEYAKVANVNVQ